MTSSNSKHILIVEDSQDLQTLLTQLFSSEGYIPMSAFNGQQALEILRSNPIKPGLILLDLMMPIMDGVQFRIEQRNDPTIAKIPVVIMSADANSRARAENLGIAGFIHKPIDDVDVLLQSVERFRLQA